MGWFTRSKPKAEAPASAKLWARERDETGQARDLARRIVIADPSSVQRDGFIVEQGTEALLLRNGKLIERCLPGFHKPLTEGSTLADTGQSVSWQQLEAVLVESGDTPFTFKIRRLRSSDGVPVEVIVAVPVRVADAGLMLRHGLQGQEAYPTTAVKQLLFRIIRAAVGELCSTHRTKQLAPSRERDERFEGELHRKQKPAQQAAELELEGVRKQQDESRADAALQRSLSERETELQREVARMKAAGELSVEKVLALQGDHAALKVFAELARTDAHKSMSGEQLEALAASSSPELARALAEARLRSGERTDAMVQQTLDRQQQGYERGFAAVESLAGSAGAGGGHPAGADSSGDAACAVDAKVLELRPPERLRDLRWREPAACAVLLGLRRAAPDDLVRRP